MQLATARLTPRSRAATLAGMVTLVAALVGGSAPAQAATTVPLHGQHRGADSTTFKTGDCGDVTSGVAWHFVLNQLDGNPAPGTVYATFATYGERTDVGAPVGNGSTQHFYVATPADTTLTDAYAIVEGTQTRAGLILSHVCHADGGQSTTGGDTATSGGDTTTTDAGDTTTTDGGGDTTTTDGGDTTTTTDGGDTTTTDGGDTTTTTDDGGDTTTTTDDGGVAPTSGGNPDTGGDTDGGTPPPPPAPLCRGNLTVVVVDATTQALVGPSAIAILEDGSVLPGGTITFTGRPCGAVDVQLLDFPAAYEVKGASTKGTTIVDGATAEVRFELLETVVEGVAIDNPAPVAPAPEPAPAVAPAELPRTGSQSQRLLGIALGLLTYGVGLVRVTPAPYRRRR